MNDHEVFNLGDIRLQSGATLPDAKLAYKTHGELNADRSNAKPLRRAPWPDGMRAWLLTPAVQGGGAVRRTPSAIGQAIAALVKYGPLDQTWTAADGTAVDATCLQ